MVEVTRRFQRPPVRAEDAQTEAVPRRDGEDAVSSGPQHTHHLVHRGFGRVVVLEGVPRHYGVEEVVGERQLIAGCMVHVGTEGTGVLDRLGVEVYAMRLPRAVALQVAELV